ncbi:Low-density lipoprotein receptor-related protein 11 [Collichthys lucidus]|uniref:Low-density lipoprotein receptor-related protein 11 n=1 Tax=Collichthys lucidus TaxID=240159 RepID=A0A4U5TVF8_COLLU|nr:Low-density lipoprotein receptor-related protein 11 [Collichthys lucidus]
MPQVFRGTVGVAAVTSPVAQFQIQINEMKQLRLLTVCFLVCSSLALECDWDQSTDQNQGLDPNSLAAGALPLDKNPEVSDAEGCRPACCKEPDCDLALVGLPADGGPQCLLVKCVIQDRDVCVLQPSEQFKIYRRKVHRAGETSHIVPLMNAVEPKTETNNETSNGKNPTKTTTRPRPRPDQDHDQVRDY